MTHYAYYAFTTDAFGHGFSYVDTHDAVRRVAKQCTQTSIIVEVFSIPLCLIRSSRVTPEGKLQYYWNDEASKMSDEALRNLSDTFTRMYEYDANTDQLILLS